MYDLRIETTGHSVQDSLRKRLRWETILIVLSAVVIAGGGAAAIFTYAGKAQPAKKVGAAAGSTTSAAGAAATGMTLEQAQQLVTQSRAQLELGSFDDAAITLDGIPEALQESSGSAALLAIIDSKHSAYQDASGVALDLVDAGKWGQAVAQFAKVEEIAPLEPELADLKANAVRMTAGIAKLREAQAKRKAGDLTRALALAKAGVRTYPEITDFEVLYADVRARLDERNAARRKAKEAAAAARKPAPSNNDSTISAGTAQPTEAPSTNTLATTATDTEEGEDNVLGLESNGGGTVF